MIAIGLDVAAVIAFLLAVIFSSKEAPHSDHMVLVAIYLKLCADSARNRQ